MIRCNVCDIQKEENQFQTYWHSTQNKMRRRKQCTECLYRIRLKNKNPDKYYSNNPDYRKCTDCKEWKLISTGFYTRSDGSVYLNRCRECEHTLEKNKRLEYLQQNCGSDRITPKPNTYTDEYQKACVFELMEKLGYLYDVPTGIWTKAGYKEIKDDKPFFPTIKPNVHKSTKFISQEKLNQMIELREQKKTYKMIAKKVGLSVGLVRKHLIPYEKIN